MSVTVGELVARGTEHLRLVTESPRMEAELLLCEAVQQRHTWLIAHPEATVEDEPLAAYEQACGRRASGEPFQYIVGSTGFYGRRFAVTPAVLVPRPETEHLIEAALGWVGPDRTQALAICDVGTGCGTIAITLACELPNARVTALDVSADAVAVARFNAEHHGVAERVRMGVADLLQGDLAQGPFDLIAANLPYVSTAYIPAFPATLAYEPRVALDGGSDGLEIYRCFLPLAKERLHSRSCLVMEAGFDSAPTLAAMAEMVFPTAQVTLLNDYAALPRLIVVRQGPH